IDTLQLHVFGNMQRTRRKVQNPLDAGGDNMIDHGLRMRRGDGDDRDVEALAAGDALQLLDVEDGHTPPRFVPDLLVSRVEERGNFEALLPESRVIRQRQTEIAGADKRDAQPPVEPQNLTEMTAQLFDVIADAADAEFTEVREVLSNLRGVEMELLGQALRGNRLTPHGVPFF